MGSPKKRKTLGEKNSRELIKVADEWFSKYIRLRDSTYQRDGTWSGLCIDECGKLILVIDADGKWKSSSNIGHFITRGHHHLRFDEINCNLQGAWCNAWRDKSSMIDGYMKGLDLKYGDGTAQELKRQSATTRSLTKDELLQIISDSKEYIKHALTHPENYMR